MTATRRFLMPAVAVLILAAGSANVARADHFSVLKFSICGFPSAPPTEESFPFPGAIFGIIGCDSPMGTYTESLTALFVGGEPVGTLGEATFDFGGGNTVTTSNLSLITGASADGSTLFVESIGIITGGTGSFAGAHGGFRSSSEVDATTFVFHTAVKMVVVSD